VRRPGVTNFLRATVLGLVGAALALFVAGSVQAPVGPFDTTLSARPALSGETLVRLAPLGTIEIDTHDSPIGLTLRVDELRLAEAERIAEDPRVLESLEGDIAADARRALARIAWRCALVAIVGGAIGAMVAWPRLRSLLLGAATGAVLAGVLGAATYATFDADAVAEPEYSGLLTVAPTAVGDVQGIVDRFGEYQAQLTDLVGNVVTLYRTAQGLPTFSPGDDTVRVLHVSDVHLNPQAFDVMELLVDQFDIDAVADTGDTTDWGTEPETQLLARIGDLEVPYVWVRGNHDSGATQRAVATQPNAIVLDGDAATVAGLRFWGTADTRYTPDKDQESGKEIERALADAAADDVADALTDDQPPEIDVAMVHDPRMAADLGGEVPLVLAGHTHNAKEDSIGSTLLLVEGSTGGAGLRGLQNEEPEPLTATVLYFDPDTDDLVAYDRITIDGLGETGARIARHVIEQD
jgi:predicted phosphodiesterase